MLLFLTFVGALSLALWSTFNARRVREGKERGVWSSTFVLGGSACGAAIYLLVLWCVLYMLGFVDIPQSSVFWWSVAVTIVINVAFEVLRFKAYALTDMALVAPFAGISPIITVFTAWLILGELPTALGLVGIFFIAGSLYLLNIKDKLSWSTLGAPFVAIWHNKGTRYAFLASIPPAFSIVFDKQAVAAADPISFSVVAYVGIACGAWLVDVFVQGKQKFFSQFSLSTVFMFFKMSFFHFVAIVAFNSALLLDVTAHISALRRTVIVFEVIFGYYLLQQKDSVHRRLMAACGVVLGVLCIAFSK